MSLYLIQAAYTPEVLQAIVQNQQDRTNTVRAPIEALGGKIHNLFFSFGEYDAVLLLEMPNNVAAAGIAMAFAAGGACKTIKTTPLLTVAEGLEAAKQAASSGYQPLVAARAAS